MSHPRVLLADDHRIVVEGLKNLPTPEFALVGLIKEDRALVEAARKLRPDVIVADITMPRLNGIEALAELKLIHFAIKQDHPYLTTSLQPSPSGFGQARR